MAVGTSNMADRKQSPQDESRVGLQPLSAPRDPPLPGMPSALKVLQVPKTVPPGRGLSIQMQEPVGQVCHTERNKGRFPLFGAVFIPSP